VRAVVKIWNLQSTGDVAKLMGLLRPIRGAICAAPVAQVLSE
jgi:hypothetical protein